MIKKVPVEEALGLPLLHDITHIGPGGIKGPLLKRGHILERADVDKLLDIGKAHIFVGGLEEDQVHEEDVALEVGPLVGDETIAVGKPSEGKVNLVANEDGLLLVQKEGLRRLNDLPDFTMPTLPHHFQVRKGDAVAGLRIIPLYTQREQVEAAKAIAKEFSPLLQVRPYLIKKVGLIITGSEIVHGRVQDRMEGVLRPKIEALGGEIIQVTFCDDGVEEIVDAATSLFASGAELILFTGGMSVDPDDVTPLSIRKLSTDFIALGLPVQPGNMLTLGYHDDCALVGVPGASLNAKITSLDLLLPTIFTKEKITAQDLKRKGLGGLCKNCQNCTYPFCYLGWN